MSTAAATTNTILQARQTSPTEGASLQVRTYDLESGTDRAYVAKRLLRIDYYGIEIPAVQVRVRGLTPLLMSNGIQMFKNAHGDLIKLPTNATHEEQAEASAYRRDDGTLYMPAAALKTSFYEGCVGSKIGKSAAKSVLRGLEPIPEDRIPLLDGAGLPITDYHIDLRRIVNKTTGGAQVIGRACVPVPWQLEVVMAFVRAPELDQLQSNISFVINMINAGSRAGRYPGIGSYRPSSGGFFGKYSYELID